MRSAYISTNQRGKRRKLPRPLPRIPAPATPPSGPHFRRLRHLEVMPVEDPHNSHDDINDAGHGSRVDSHRSLHQMQLLAIRKFFDESEPNFKDKHETTAEDESVEASNSGCGKRVDEVEHLWAEPKERRKGRQNVVTKSPLKSTKEGQADSIDSTDADWKCESAWQGGGEKPLTQLRRWCQNPRSALIRSSTIQAASLAKQKETSITLRNKESPSFDSACGEIPRCSSKAPKEMDLSAKNLGGLSPNTSGKEADRHSLTTGCAFPDLPSLRKEGSRRVMDAVKRFEMNINDVSKSTNLKPSPILPTKKRMGLSRDNPVNRRVSHFAQSWTEGSKLSQSPSAYSLNSAVKLCARKAQEDEGSQEEETNKRVDSASSQWSTETPLFIEERLTPPRYRPLGGIDIYTTQGTKLMQEMKDRFKKKQDASHVEPELKCRPKLALLTDQPTVSKIEKAPHDAQRPAPLPTNLGNDLSHILPSVLKERPKRPGRLPSRYATQLLPADNPKNSTGV